MTTLHNPQPSMQSAETIFSRVLVGIDGSPESLDAARQAVLQAKARRDTEAPGGLEPRAAARDANDDAAGLRRRRAR